jgi:adenine-specific DNA-methyltransferase
MPTLDWIGKKAVVNHHRDVPYRLIHCDKDKSVGDPDAGNLLVQGDNLEALKALLPYYAGKVKCIYIDPPYNTGKADWAYSDKVDSPEIAEWLGRAVGKEAEDLCRHDKWLCMMYPRIILMKEFLTGDGLVFVSCDDNEQAALHLLLAEIFGRGNHVGTAIWKNATDNNPTQIAVEHEYVAVYARDKNNLARQWSGLEEETKDLMLDVFSQIERDHGSIEGRQKAFSAFIKKNSRSLGDLARYKRVDERGVYVARRNLENPGKNGYQYEVIHPVTERACEKPLWGWRFPKERMDELIKDGRIIFGKDELKIPELKAYLVDVGFPFRSVMNIDSRKGSNDIEGIFGRRDIFKNPKSVEFIIYLLSFVSKDDDIIMDSFAGSGTTGQAVLEMNRHDGKRRQFILIEMDRSTSADITAERLRRVISGYAKGGDGTKPIEGMDSGFRFCTLGEPLFDTDGNVSSEVTFPDLAAHIFFCETGSPIPRRAEGASPLIGTFQDRAIYLLHGAGSLGVADERAGNVLTSAMLGTLPAPSADFTGTRVVYAEGCTLPDDRLAAAGVTFKQVPYQIEGL